MKVIKLSAIPLPVNGMKLSSAMSTAHAELLRDPHAAGNKIFQEGLDIF